MSFETDPEDDWVIAAMEPHGLVRLLKEYAEKNGWEPWSYIKQAMEEAKAASD